MIKAYRADAREHLKNCIGARFSAEALVIALAGGRWADDQSDWSIECDRIISLLDDDADYRRGFEDGLRTNTRAAFAAAKQAMTERTCRNVDNEYPYFECSECGCEAVVEYSGAASGLPYYCPYCGAKVVE